MSTLLVRTLCLLSSGLFAHGLEQLASVAVLASGETEEVAARASSSSTKKKLVRAEVERAHGELGPACWEELGCLSDPEGTSVGQIELPVLAHSDRRKACKKLCLASPRCSSFAHCPEWGSCMFSTSTTVDDSRPHCSQMANCSSYKKSNCGTDMDQMVQAGCFAKLEGVAKAGGEQLGRFKATSGEECLRLCAQVRKCESLRWCGAATGECWLKTAALTPQTETEAAGSCHTWYKAVDQTTVTTTCV
mmetsp:Transcript_10477/g.23797  ORF Transcript_10477/g.23797 Transcript_10477/m.23797 type:complete len:248 (+) Transcript_10477:92-835(+)